MGKIQKPSNPEFSILVAPSVILFYVDVLLPIMQFVNLYRFLGNYF
jgi:hypothetical protein